MAIYDSMCERYGITLGRLLDNYSMAQIALISHVAYLKMEDQEREMKDKKSTSGGKKFLNRTNEQAYMLIAGGILG